MAGTLRRSGIVRSGGRLRSSIVAPPSCSDTSLVGERSERRVRMNRFLGLVFRRKLHSAGRSAAQDEDEDEEEGDDAEEEDEDEEDDEEDEESEDGSVSTRLST